MPESIHVEIYSRPGCHLCDDAKAVVERFAKAYRLHLTVTDVDTVPELRAAYGTEIPVVWIEGQEAFRHRVDAAQLERRLKELWNR
jgi:glutaredoxin